MSPTLIGVEQNAVISKRLRQGERSAWEELYEIYSHDLWRYVARLMGEDRETVAEVVQEVFIAAAKNAHCYDSNQGSIWAWLTGIAHRQSASWFRLQTRANRVSTKSVQHRLQQQANQSASEGPVMILEKVELRGTVRLILAELSAEYAMLLTAKYIDNLSVEEIQLRFGGTSDSIRSKLKRARSEFRELFEKINSGGLE